jgi:osmotically-inducible protein OsmY
MRANPVAFKHPLHVKPNEGAIMSNDVSLSDAIINGLRQDPRIPDATDIAVDVDDGVVTLRGTVGSFAQRRAAADDASKLEAAYEVENQLKVDLRDGEDRREDDAIRGAALQNLIWDVQIPSDSVNVKVRDGDVTLTGDVDYQYQSDAAYDDVSRLKGVLNVTNEITVSGS